MDQKLHESNANTEITSLADRLANYYEDLLTSEIVSKHSISDPYSFIENRVFGYFRDIGNSVKPPILSHFRYLKYLNDLDLIEPYNWCEIPTLYTGYCFWCRENSLIPCFQESFKMRLEREGYLIEEDRIKLNKSWQ